MKYQLLTVKEDGFGNLSVSESNGGKFITIQNESDIKVFYNDATFSALDEGYSYESDMNKADAIDEVNRGWTMHFRLGLDLWQAYLEVFGY